VARIAGVNIPDEKRIEISLTYVFGIGRTKSQRILEAAKVDPQLRTKSLSEADLSKIREAVEGAGLIEGDLRREVGNNIKRLKDINSYRGSRHKLNLPAHGQRTKTNGRTKRGKKQTAGSGRKKAAAKT
jgi:small subunit ribosomal protein S13